ncbi:MAG: hypothetical protein IJD04_03355 [Desulfovibrionaceae bacterium]|nr:hypothetical protein [Desulfovibrionaceae bacterium]
MVKFRLRLFPCEKLFPSATLLCLFLFLAGCTNSYTVKVDSLSDFSASSNGPYWIEPGNPQTSPNDLLFREVARLLEPVFAARGYAIAQSRSDARNIARVSYWESPPRTIVETGTEYDYKTFVDWEGEAHQVYVEEPTITSYTVYTANLRIEGYAGMDKNAVQIWRTSASTSSLTPDFRTMLARMIPALQGTLGTHTDGMRSFEIQLEDNDKIRIEDTTDSYW